MIVVPTKDKIPPIAVVIGLVSTEDRDRVLETLASLHERQGDVECEVVLADRRQDEISALIRGNAANLSSREQASLNNLRLAVGRADQTASLSKALQSEFTRRGFTGGRDMSLAELKLTMGCDEPPAPMCVPPATVVDGWRREFSSESARTLPHA